MRSLALTVVLVAITGIAAFPSVAAASHPLVERGRARYEEADFGAALDAFAQAEASDDLTLDDLVALLEMRALVRFAQGDAAGMQTDLTALAVVDRAHRFPAHAPPEIAEAFSTARAASADLAVSVRARRHGDEVVVRVSVRGGLAGLVRALRVHHRAGDSAWSSDDGEEVRVSSASRVAYYVELIGPGGAVIARAGNARSPRIVSPRSGASGATRGGGEGSRRTRGSSGFPVWPVVGAVAGVAVIATVVVVVVAASGGQSLDRPSAPMIE